MKRDGVTKRQTREAAYKWLAEQLNIPIDDCHVGLFREGRCREAIALLKRYCPEEDTNQKS